MTQERSNQFESDIELPDGMRQSLRAAGQPEFEVPPAMDATIRAAAGRHFRSAGRRRRIRILASVSAAAAAVLLLIWFNEPVSRMFHESPAPSLSIARGEVTILDAFALARQLKQHQTPGRGWDYTADGIVDRRDVDAIAMAAVRLGRGT